MGEKVCTCASHVSHSVARWLRTHVYTVVHGDAAVCVAVTRVYSPWHVPLIGWPVSIDEGLRR